MSNRVTATEWRDDTQGAENQVLAKYLKNKTNDKMDKLGKMIRITDLRSVWPHEANDFTKWLAQEENLTLLGDAIDIELGLFGE